MESFFRYISYVDYYKKGERIKNVGFLRWKLHNNEHRIELQLKDVFGVQGDFEIKEKNTGKAIGEIKIDKGIGNFMKQFPSMAASGEMYIDTLDDRLYLSDVEGFIIRLDGNGYLSVAINLEQEKKQDRFEEIMDKKEEDKLSVISEISDREEQRLISERDYIEQRLYDENNIVKKPKQIFKREDGEELSAIYKESNKKEQMPVYKECNKKEQMPVYEESNKEEQMSVYGNNISKNTESFLGKEEEKTFRGAEAASENVLMEGIEKKYVDSVSNKKIKIIEPIHEDKWQQLCSKYQKVHPFPGKKVFLSIKPEDFIVLQQGYQKLVHNSFLLHGFYNYGHMILGKLTDDEEAPVYIGVPGVYYEREKQAAQMFGFVGFESTEHPVQAGSYGYYMIEVEI